MDNNYQFCALHLNIHSLLAQFDQLKDAIATLSDHNITVNYITLCETFLNDDNMALAKIDGYNLICRNRGPGLRGGVAIYILSTLSYTIRDDLAVNVDREFESVVLKSMGKGGTLLLVKSIEYPIPMKKVQ